MKYMLLTYMDEQKWFALTPAQQQEEMAKCEPHVQRLASSGKLLDGAPLHPTSMATTVRVREGKRLVTDGPFAEAREQLGGYTLIEAKDLDEAIEIAAGFMGDGSWATIEVRPVVDLTEMPHLVEHGYARWLLRRDQELGDRLAQLGRRFGAAVTGTVAIG
jgi:hypothetical protein